MFANHLKINNNRVYLLWLIVAIVIIIAVLSYSYFTNADSNNSISGITITLKEAYEISISKMQEINKNAELRYITSVDNPEINNCEEGIDGKRRFWNVIYTIPDKETQYILTIHDGHVVKTNIGKGPSENTILLNSKDIKIDSPQALEVAKSHFKINMGKGWAKGFNFVLMNNNGKKEFVVVAQDHEGYFSKIYIDPISGKILFAEHKLPFGGLLYKNDEPVFIECLKETYWISGFEISPDYRDDGTIITWGIIKPATPDSNTILLISKNYGKSWNRFNFSQPIDKIVFSENYHNDGNFFIKTGDDLILTNDKLQSNEIKQFNSPIIDVQISNGRVIVLCEKNIYSSDNNGQSWRTDNIPQNTYMVRINSSQLYVYDKKTIYRNNNGNWNDITYPLTDTLVGFEIVNNHLVACSEKEIGIYDTDSHTWKIINNNVGIISGIEKNINSKNVYIIYSNGNICNVNTGGDSIDNYLNLEHENINLSTIRITDDYFYCTKSYSQWSILPEN